MKNRSIKSILIIILFFIMLILLVLLLNINDSSLVINNNSRIYISEIMPNNKTTIQDSDNEYSDYIEIYNDYDYDINLLGYYLSDDDFDTKKWKFPDVTIKSKSYLVVFASGKNQIIEDEIHTNFKLSSNKEVVALTDKEGKLLSKIREVSLESNIEFKN